MFVVIRAVVYASAFIGLFLVFIPARLLQRSGLEARPEAGLTQILGMVVAAAGGALALWCILSFATLGAARRRRSIRHAGWWCAGRTATCASMYIGAALALLGAACVPV